MESLHGDNEESGDSSPDKDTLHYGHSLWEVGVLQVLVITEEPSLVRVVVAGEYIDICHRGYQQQQTQISRNAFERTSPQLGPACIMETVFVTFNKIDF